MRTSQYHRRNRRPDRGSHINTQGFTIIEVLVAILILGLLVGAMVFTNSLFLGQKNNNSTYAYNAARQGLEAYRSSWSISENFKAGTTPAGIPLTLNAGCQMSMPTIQNYYLDQENNYALKAATGTIDVRKVQVKVTCPKLKDVVISTEIADPEVKVLQ